MAEQLTVYEVGDRFATITKEGRAQVYQVSEHGHPVAVGPVTREYPPVSISVPSAPVHESDIVR
jgi:hypothetical protein